LLGACFSANRPIDSTQTGNPPTIDSSRVALKVSDHDAHVTGDAGAVSPIGATIEVTNLTTGEVTKGKPAADGSFDLVVPGSPNDAFVVKAQAGGVASGAVYVVRGSAAVGDGAGGALSCDQRDQLAGELLTRVGSGANASCGVDSDCHAVLEVASCHDRCQYAIVSQAGQRELEAASQSLDTGLCADYAKDGCKNVLLPCVAPPPVMCSSGQCVQAGQLECQQLQQMASEQRAAATGAADKSCAVDADCTLASADVSCLFSCPGAGRLVASRAGAAAISAAVSSINQGWCANAAANGCAALPYPCESRSRTDAVCMNGQCALGSVPSNPPPACATCLKQALRWGRDGGLVAYVDTSTLEPCLHYSRSRREAAVSRVELASCQVDFSDCTALASSGAVQTALANGDVQQALDASPVLYGADRRPVDVPVFRIQIDSRIIDVGDSCAGAPPNCIPTPAGVQALVDLLQAIDQAETATACQSFGPSASCKSSVPAAPSGCHAAGYYLQCMQGSATQSCVSDSATQCPDLGGTNIGTCIDLCTDSEYAVGCGGVGPNAPSFTPPAGCRGFGRNPGGGSEAFCCPCDGVSR
jgi:hypothetical protein